MSSETRGFETAKTIEQTPFDEAAAREFLTEWCAVNDSIEPIFVSRTEYADHQLAGKSPLTTDLNANGHKELFVPKDLHLWEMVPLIKAVDTDTFAQNPKRGAAKAEQLVHLGVTFENVGIYLAKRAQSLDSGQQLADTMAADFYSYGRALATGIKPTAAKPEQIRQLPDLAPEATDQVDRWLAGDKLYQQRHHRVELAAAADPAHADDIVESERHRALKSYFGTAEKAFDLQQAEADGKTSLSAKHLEDRKPWQDTRGAHETLIAQARHQIDRAVEAPIAELTGAVGRRGVEFLQRQLGYDKLPQNSKNIIESWANGETTLRAALKVDDLREELEAVKERGDLNATAAKERQIADTIQNAVRLYGYKSRQD